MTLWCNVCTRCGRFIVNALHDAREAPTQTLWLCAPKPPARNGVVVGSLGREARLRQSISALNCMTRTDA